MIRATAAHGITMGTPHPGDGLMKSKTLALATLLLVTAFLLMQAIVPHTALADSTWTNTGGDISGREIYQLAYDSGHNML